MATQVLTNAYISVNGVNLSDHCVGLELPEGVDAQDATAMGTPPLTKIFKPGLVTASIKATFLQDFANGSVDLTLSPLIGITTSIEVRPVNTTVGVNNPKWTGTVFITSYNPIAGTVGEMQKCQVEFALASALVRGTA